MNETLQEIAVLLLVVAAAVYLIVRNRRRQSDCNCGCCPAVRRRDAGSKATAGSANLPYQRR